MLCAPRRLVHNNNRDSENSPASRAFVGKSRVGDAWEARSTAETPPDYLRVKLNDPSLAEPLNAALFWSENGKEAQLVWNQRRPE